MGSLQKQPWDTLSSFDQAEAAIQHFKAALPPTEIPSLDDLAPSEIHNYVGQVVRWSLMVQDTTLGREVFAHRTAKAKSLLFREALETPEDDEPDFNSLAERDVFFCVNQRALDDSAERLDSSMGNLNIDETQKAHSKIIKKFPNRNPHATGVLVKSYTEENFKASELIEFTGVLDAAHFVPSSTDDQPEQIPCLSLHILWHEAVKPQSSKSMDDWIACQDDLLHHITNLLNGDRLAAKYTLLGLISRIHTRKEGLTLGQFPVNLRTHASVDICSLTSFLSQLISPSQVLELTIASLNNATNVYSPVSHDESLDAGRLQLPAHSLVLVDETKMDEGKLESHGLRNLNSLAKTMGEAKLDYIFPFSQFCFDVDFNHIVFSKSKSLLPVSNVVPVKSQKGEPPSQVTVEQIEEWQACLQAVKLATFAINDDKVAAHIEEKFVDMRQKDSSIGHDDLMRLMSLARLVALYRGETALSTEAFDEARTMEESRLARLQT